MRNTEGLVQIEVAHVGAELSWLCQPNKRIEVRSINIDLATVLMNESTNIGDGCFKNTVCGWVGNHECCEFCGVLHA